MNGDQPDPIRRIVVGVDGSDGAMRAVMWSARLARATGAEVVAAHATESPLFMDGFPLVTGTIPTELWDVAWKEWRQHTRELLEQRWCRPLAAARVRYRAELIAGGPKELIEFAGSEEAA
jgi:nucleotide-binding universal stress UspA family protein